MLEYKDTLPFILQDIQAWETYPSINVEGKIRFRKKRSIKFVPFIIILLWNIGPTLFDDD